MWHTQKIRLYFEFYKSTLAVNLFISFIWLFYSLGTFFISFCTFGLIAVFLFKEYYRKNEYYFYYNNSINRTTLFMFCFILNIIISIVIKILSHELLP